MPAPVPAPVRTFAHLTGSELPVPTWLLAYGTGFGVVLAFLLFRSIWPRPRLRTGAAGRDLPGPVQAIVRPAAFVLRTVGVFAYSVVLAAALFGVDSDASNLAPYATHITFWLGLMFVSVLIGDLWRTLDPFPPMAAVVFGRRLPEATERGSPGLWPSLVAVGSLLWLQLAYHSSYSPRVVAGWLLAVTVGAMVGAARWGRQWLRRDEGFAGLFGLIAAMAPLFDRAQGRRLAVRWPLTGLAPLTAGPGGDALLLTVIGAVGFDGINNTSWWVVDVMGARTGWSRTAVSTAGLVFFVGAAALVWFGAARWSARLTGELPAAVAAAHLPALVPVAGGYVVAHYVGLLVFETYNVVALVSDPFGRGWDLFGTISTTPNFSILSTTTIAAIGVLAVALGHIGAALVVHDRSLERHRSPRTAARSATPFIGALTVSAVVGILVLPGG